MSRCFALIHTREALEYDPGALLNFQVRNSICIREVTGETTGRLSVTQRATPQNGSISEHHWHRYRHRFYHAAEQLTNPCLISLCICLYVYNTHILRHGREEDWSHLRLSYYTRGAVLYSRARPSGCAPQTIAQNGGGRSATTN
jgi:hypothetical protein